MKEKHYDRLLQELGMGISRDDLAGALQTSFEAIIKEAGDWRPLADHVINLMVLAVKKADEGVQQ